MSITRNQARSNSRKEEERSKGQARLTEEARKRQEEIRRAEEREAWLREQLKLLKSAEGNFNPPPPQVAWGQSFSEQIDETPIPP
ncbi:hypothetical protein CR513_18074, partial [Mucuna pruriens]